MSGTPELRVDAITTETHAPLPSSPFTRGAAKSAQSRTTVDALGIRASFPIAVRDDAARRVINHNERAAVLLRAVASGRAMLNSADVLAVQGALDSSRRLNLEIAGAVRAGTLVGVSSQWRRGLERSRRALDLALAATIDALAGQLSDCHGDCFDRVATALIARQACLLIDGVRAPVGSRAEAAWPNLVGAVHQHRI